MAKTTNIEYYQTCPSCGAVNNGKDFCDFCGAYLIKSRTQTENAAQDIYDEERENELEDAGYPVIVGKSGNINTFLVLFCSIFGGVFVFVPIVLLLAFSSTGSIEPFVIIIAIVFLAVGIGSFVPLIKNINNHIKCKNGTEITGIVRGYEESMVTMNGRPVLNIRILINDKTNPQILLLNSGVTRRAYPIDKTIKLKNNGNSYMIVE